MSVHAVTFDYVITLLAEGDGASSPVAEFHRKLRVGKSIFLRRKWQRAVGLDRANHVLVLDNHLHKKKMQLGWAGMVFVLDNHRGMVLLQQSSATDHPQPLYSPDMFRSG
jgi:hypothetical protein